MEENLKYDKALYRAIQAVKDKEISESLFKKIFRETDSCIEMLEDSLSVLVVNSIQRFCRENDLKIPYERVRQIGMEMSESHSQEVRDIVLCNLGFSWDSHNRELIQKLIDADKLFREHKDDKTAEDAVAEAKIAMTSFSFGKALMESFLKNIQDVAKITLQLPVWKKAERDIDCDTCDFIVKYKHDGGDRSDWEENIMTNRLRKGELYIDICDLDKLPKV